MKTTTVSVYAAFFFILVLSVSCRRDSEASDVAFQKIEICMESLPDTALYLLKSVPHPEKLRGKSQADYALLLTQAMDQNYVKFTSDSLIALALNYYTVGMEQSIPFLIPALNECAKGLDTVANPSFPFFAG